jgi:hypothetical protein
MIDGGEAWDLNTARSWGRRFEPLKCWKSLKKGPSASLLKINKNKNDLVVVFIYAARMETQRNNQERMGAPDVPMVFPDFLAIIVRLGGLEHRLAALKLAVSSSLPHRSRPETFRCLWIASLLTGDTAIMAFSA